MQMAVTGPTRTYPLPQGGSEERFVTLALVKDVSNCARLKSQVSAGLIDAALLSPRLVRTMWRTHLLSALYSCAASFTCWLQSAKQ